MSSYNWQKKWHDYFTSEKPTLFGLDDLEPAGSANIEEVLEHYRWSYRESLKDMLLDKFYVTLKLLSDSHMILEDYIQKMPSTFSTIDDYGRGFSEYLASRNESLAIVELSKLEEEIYLFSFNIPRFEETTAWNELASVTQLVLQNGFLLKSEFDIFEIWNEEVKLDMSKESYAVIHYKDENTKVTSLSKWEYELLLKFEFGASLSDLDIKSLGNVEPEAIQMFFSFLREYNLLGHK